MRILLLAVIASLCACTNLGTAHPVSHPPAHTASVAPATDVAVAFSAEEIQMIRAYYQANAGAKHGKGKSKGLPPGIAKNLRKGKPLPPGIAKRALPYDLRITLPQLPAGYDRYVVAGKILLVELGTQVVRDILTDVAFR